MNKILQFDKFGRYKATFNSVSEIRAMIQPFNYHFDTMKNNSYILRNLFRESYTAFSSIFAFDNDERIIYKDGQPYRLDAIEEFHQYKPSPNFNPYTDKNGNNFLIFNTLEECKNLDYVQVIYKPLVKKFDQMESKYYILCKFAEEYGKEPVVVRNVKAARELTGAKQIWGCLLGECKVSNGVKFEFITFEKADFFGYECRI